MTMTRPMMLPLTLAALLAGLASAAPAQDGPPMGPGPAFNFDAVDADKDGKVTQAELDAFRAAEARAIDANADGKLDLAELSAMHLARLTERADDMAARMVERHDTDGDNALSAAELAARPMPAMMFDQMDSDGDGAVTRAEADALRDRMHDRMDGRHGHGKHRGVRDRVGAEGAN